MDTATAPFETGPFTQASSRSFTDEGRDPRHDNQPPLEERVMLEFTEDLERAGLTARIAELAESAGRVPDITDDAIAGKVGDLCKMARDVEKRVDDAREKHNRPLINARNALKGRADAVLGPLQQAIGDARRKLDAYMADQARKAAEERRRAEEEARRLQEEANASASLPEYAPRVEAPKIAEPVARGDLGARVGTRTVWKHEIQVPIAKLPKHILENQKVREAVDQVIAAMVRGGARNPSIKGVNIYETTAAAIR